MAERAIADTVSKYATVLHNGKAALPIKAGQANAFKAKSGEHYRVLKGKEGEEQLLDNVVVKHSGNDLKLDYADGTQVTLENYYVVCRGGDCDVVVPSKAVEGYKISAASTGGASLGDGSTLVYAHGGQDALMGMAHENVALQTVLGSFKGAEVTYLPPAYVPVALEASGSNWALLGGGLALAAGAAAGLGGGGGGADVIAPAAAVHNLVGGGIVAGPVVAGNGLTVNLFKADGVTLLGTQKLSDAGTFSIDVGSYTGAVIGKLVDAGAGNDFIDEATGQARDMNANLMAVGVAGSGTTTVNMNALTTIAALKAGAIFAGASVGVITSAVIVQTNAAVAGAFGLADLIGSSVVTTVDVNGSANAAFTPAAMTAAVKYGAALAALSGMDAANGGDMQATIDWLEAGITMVGSAATLSNARVDAVVLGATTASANTGGTGATSLTAMISNMTAQTSASVSINQIATDGVISAAEQNSTISGTTVAGAAVNLTLGGNVRAATVAGTNWSYDLTGADIAAIGQGGEVMTATATLAGGGTATATRSAVVDTVGPSVTSVAITSATGIQNNTLNAGDVVSVTVRMSEGTTVTGTPQLSLNIGGTTVLANYASGSGTPYIVFTYTVLAGQTDINGISIGANSLTLNGGTLVDAAGNTATVTHAAIADNAGYLIDNTAPTLATTTYSAAENATAVATLAGTDAGAITYSLGGAGADNALFSISSGGALTFLTAKNFEAPGSAASTNAYAITVNLTDAAGNVTNQAVTVNVTNVNEAPVMTSGATANFAENATGTVYTAAATDVDAGTTLTYTMGGADSALFNINASTGAVTFKAAPNYEAPSDAGANNVYDITVTASDGSLTATQAVAITVTNLNDNAPVFTSGGTGTVAENAATSTVIYTAATTDADNLAARTYTVSGTDAGLVDITSAGVVTLKASADYESKTSYSFNVIANDGANNTTQAVVVSVTNVNEAPVMTSGATASFAENATGTVYTAAATDVDAGTTLTYTMGGADSALFNINASTGAVTFKAAPNYEAPTDAGANNVYDITVTASDGSLTATQAVAITVTNVNEAPAMTGGSTANFAENATGTVYTAAATDVDAGTTLTYTMGGTDSALFNINASTGAVTFKAAPNYEAPSDAGANNVYDITVTASDGSLTATQAVAITVTNVNEAPVMSSGSTANFSTGGTGTVYTATATDVDAGTTLTYTLGGTDSALFNINASTGAVTFKTAPNFETPSDAGANNVYDITVTASDGSLTATQVVAVAVNNNHAPAMTSGLMATSIFEVADAAAATSTAYTLLAGQTAQGTLTGTGDEDWYKVYLTSGQQYTFATTGVGTSNVQDTLLGLYNSSGVLLTYNDDGLPGKNSTFSYTPNASGYYYIGARAYAPSDSGAYELTFTSGSSPSFDAAMGAGVIDSDLSWGAAGSPVAITYGFRQSWSSAYSSTSNLGTFSQLTATEMSGVRTDLQFWSDICGITFTEVSPGGYTNSATMLIGNYSDATDGAGAFAYYPNTANTSFASSDGDLWLNLAGGISSSSLPIGSYSLFAILHEFGHAIGLSHPGLYNAAPGVSITYADNAQFVQDSNQYSVMSYFGGASTGAFSQRCSTPMMFDILAAQNIYGVNTSTRATDTIYGFNSTAGNAYLFSGSTAASAFCIWDGAGTDTIDVSGFAQNQLVDLCAGTFSDVGSLTGNVSIAIGCSIENVKGGSGSDVIFGNSLNNIITGGAGNDMLFGGAGSDTAIFSSARSSYVISSMTDGWSVVGTDGTDQLFNVEYAQFSDQTVTLAENSSYVITSYVKASFAENSTGTVYTATATDVDAGTTLSYSLGGADASLFNISSAGAVTFKAAPNYEAPADAGANNVYNVTVTASDGVNVSDAQEVAITVTNVGDAGDSVIDLGSYGKLIAPVEVEGKWYYYWDRSGDGSSADTGSLNGGVDYTSHDVLDGIFTKDINGVTGGAGNTTDTYRYATLNGVQVALPTANGGVAYPQGINSYQNGTTYTDAGATTNSTASSFNELLAIWDAYNGTGTGTNISGTPTGWQAVGGFWSATPSASGHAHFTLNHGYVYDSIDINGLLGYVALQVLGNNIAAPIITSAASASFAENGTGTAYTVTGTDADLGTTLTYALGGTDAAKFSINASTGAVTFVTAPNFEAPTDAGANNVYDITVTANDGVNTSAAQAVAITVTNVNEAPAVSSGATASFAENGAGTVYTATGTDADAGTTLSYALGGTDAAKFVINASTGAVTFVTAPNFEAPTDAGGNNVYDITVTSNDGVNTSAALAVAITVTNVNEFAPVITSAATASFAENGADTAYTATGTDADAGTSLSYALGGTDAAKFAINASTGAVTFKTTPNFEAPTDAGANNVYDITVTASDGGLTATQAVAITVTNVNEVPVMTSGSTANFAESATGTVYTAAATDVDAGTTLTYTMGGTDSALFSINASTGAVTFKAAPNFEAPTDAGSNNVYDITVTASDGSLTATQAVAITVTNVNEAPVMTSGATANFAENATGTVYAVTATDVDAGTTLTYTMGGTDSALFNINASTGAVTFKTAPNFEAPTDAGANNVYEITVTASDGSLLAAQAVAITLTNVNEAPVMTSAATASFAENATGTVYTATATDVDAGTTLTYTMGGADSALFNINASTGAVTFKTAPNFEAPSDSGANNVYDITVTASDGSLSATQAAAITVTNVTDAGDAVIDLGSYGKLIAPVQADGGYWYYYWDRNGDGIGTNTGTPQSNLDYTTHNVLDGLFNHDVNGVQNTTIANADGFFGTTEMYRYAVINGVHLALPTFGGGTVAIDNTYRIGTSAGDAGRENGSNAINSTYDDLMAIWDAYNGTWYGTFDASHSNINDSNIPNTTGQVMINGTPQGWEASYLGYWSATATSNGHQFVNINTGNYGGSDGSDDGNSNYVVLQVLPG